LKLLLDTHVLLWALLKPALLSQAATEAIEDAANEVYVSVVSAWEIEIKSAKGKLSLPETLPEALDRLRYISLPVSLDQVLTVESLPRHHRDPFDRILIAQAQLEGMTLVTSDRHIRHYPVATLPAT
jgi:PIN domain nuclease of toxin-antitoxin system